MPHRCKELTRLIRLTNVNLMRHQALVSAVALRASRWTVASSRGCAWEMDLAEAAVSLAAAVIGAGAAIGATFFTVRRAAEDARAEARFAERSALEALLIEMDVVERIAVAHSATILPTRMLDAGLPAVHHMGTAGKSALIQYAEAVGRYNGRVQRLVAYGAAKRARGEDPGSEKLGETHVTLVTESVGAARLAIRRHLDAPRLRGLDAV
jgi:hypothetical protein